MDKELSNGRAVMAADKTNSRTLDLGAAIPSNPLLSGDGRYLFFIDRQEQKSTLRRYEMATGDSANIVPQLALTSALTADSRFIIYSTYNPERRQTLHRVSIEGGAPLRIITPAAKLSLPTLLNHALEWSSEGRWLYFLNDQGASNIFRVAADGTNKTEQMTKFPAGFIFNFSLAPDGKRAAIARGSTANDIVIFKNSPLK